MNGFLGDPDFDHAAPEGSAVLVTNLGTPEAPTTAAVRRYLAEFLADPRVVEQPRWLWLPILHGIILRVRPARSAKAYRKVWTPAGSPLLDITRRQAEALEQALAARNVEVPVRFAMRYGTPSIAQTLAEFRGQGLARLVVLPLYPQYSGSTTGSTFDALAAELRRWRRVPRLDFVDCYHDRPAYIEALAASVREAWAQAPRAERTLFSFHGLPQRYLLAGDPYHCQCHATARALARALALEDDSWAIAFQSRVGREPWLKPYTDHVLEQWGAAGVRSCDVVCPGFSADCLETLEEIDMGERERFIGAGGEQFRYIPALNDRPAHVEMLADLAQEALAPWPATATAAARLGARAERARALGAAR